MEIRGTPVNINGRTGGTPGPAPSTSVMRVEIPVPQGRQIGGTPFSPMTTFARQLTIRNLDVANSLKVYLNDSFVTIPPGSAGVSGERTFNGTIPFFSIQASAATVQWEATAIVAA